MPNLTGLQCIVDKIEVMWSYILVLLRTLAAALSAWASNELQALYKCAIYHVPFKLIVWIFCLIFKLLSLKIVKSSCLLLHTDGVHASLMVLLINFATVLNKNGGLIFLINYNYFSFFSQKSNHYKVTVLCMYVFYPTTMKSPKRYKWSFLQLMFGIFCIYCIYSFSETAELDRYPLIIKIQKRAIKFWKHLYMSFIMIWVYNDV